MPTALAISPHLDDAVFSAGGLLARLAHQGWRVVIATVFAQSIPAPTGFALACQLDKGLAADVDYMALRRDEDASACAILGAEPLWLPFPEAPHRGYGSAEALFSGLRADDEVVEAIAPSVGAEIRRLQPSLLLAPRAVGAHVDHVAVYLALRRLPGPVRFWLDFPYAIRPAHRPSPFEAEIAALTQTSEPLSDTEIGLKCRAAKAYASQLGFQFGNAATADAAVGAVTAEQFAVRA